MEKNKDIKKQCKKCQELEKQIQELALSMDKIEDEKALIQGQLVKVLADYQNLLKSSEKRSELRLFQSKKSLLENILPTLDALNMAIESSKKIKFDEEGKSWLGGIYAIFESLNKAVKEIGLEQYIPEKGDKFDSSIHEALAVTEGGNSGEIFEVIQPGYRLDDTVIRPARVVVSK